MVGGDPEDDTVGFTGGVGDFGGDDLVGGVGLVSGDADDRADFGDLESDGVLGTLKIAESSSTTWISTIFPSPLSLRPASSSYSATSSGVKVTKTASKSASLSPDGSVGSQSDSPAWGLGLNFLRSDSVGLESGGGVAEVEVGGEGGVA